MLPIAHIATIIYFIRSCRDPGDRGGWALVRLLITVIVFTVIFSRIEFGVSHL
jgi:hypothetical protein